MAELYAPEVNPLCEVVPEKETMLLDCATVPVSSSAASLPTIQKIVFASYGNPTGTCGSFSLGGCHFADTQRILEKLCLNRSSCTLNLDELPNPCFLEHKWLSVEALCGVSATSGPSNATSWDFSLIDPLMEDFMAATEGRNVTINFR